jgi:hypothetical protein
LFLETRYFDDFPARVKPPFHEPLPELPLFFHPCGELTDSFGNWHRQERHGKRAICLPETA